MLTFALTLLLWPQSWAAELQSTVDRNTLAVNETLVLSVQFDGQVISDPDFSDLEKDFEILSQQQQNQLSIVNGKRTSYTTWTIQLLPKRSGKLLIPSFNLKGAVSNAIQLDVTDAPQSTASSDQPVYIVTSVDKETVYVQEQLILTHQLYTRVNLSSVSSDELTIPGADLTKISESQYQKNLNGVLYLIVETKYAVFPQTNGSLEIPSLRYTAVVPDNRDPFSSSLFSRGGRQIFLRSESKSLTVKPRPTNISPDAWLPSKGVSLTEKWSRPLDQLRVGEPVTRTINIIAQELSAVQLPPLQIPNGDGFRLYPDQPQMNDEKNATGVIGQRTESVAIVPTNTGEITLPPITVSWWDTASHQLRQTTLEARVLQVLPATVFDSPPESDAISSNPPATNDTVTVSTAIKSPWITLLAASNLLLLLIIVLLVWLLFRKQSNVGLGKTEETEDLQEQVLFRQLRQAARKQNYSEFQQLLFPWARVFWKDSHVSSISQVIALSQSSRLAALLAEIDQQNYSSKTSAEMDFNPVIDELEHIRKALNEDQKDRKNHLKPLYP